VCRQKERTALDARGKEEGWGGETGTTPWNRSSHWATWRSKKIKSPKGSYGGCHVWGGGSMG